MKESGTPKLDETLPNFIKRKHPRKGEKKKQRARTEVQASKHGGRGTAKYLNCIGKMTAWFSTTELCGLGYQTRGMSHCGLAIYIKQYLTAKEELWKLKYFTKQKYNLQKNPLKETKILQDISVIHKVRQTWHWKPMFAGFRGHNVQLSTKKLHPRVTCH